MSTSRKFFHQVRDILDVFGSARRAAFAVETGRTPAARDLATLGISAEAFRSVQRN